MELTIFTLLPSLHVEPMMDLFTLHLSPKMLPLPTMQPADTVALLPSFTVSCTKFSKRLLGFSVSTRDAKSNAVNSLQVPTHIYQDMQLARVSCHGMSATLYSSQDLLHLSLL